MLYNSILTCLIAAAVELSKKKCELLFGSCLAHFSVLLHFELILVFFRDFLL